MASYENLTIFREYDLRGLAEEELTEDFCGDLGRVLARYFHSYGLDDILICRDNRLSSERIFATLSGGLRSGGCGICDLGQGITPYFYFARQYLGVEGGVMITASHNPPEYNGFKIARGPGTIHGEEIQGLRRMLLEGFPEPATGTGSLAALDLRERYLDTLAHKIKLSGPMRVVVDGGHGAAGPFAVAFLDRLGCEVVSLHCRPDGHFPVHEPDPVRPANLRDLRRSVRENGADLGLAFDGDGDRLGVVDEVGNIIWGDRLMILFWREILARHPGAEALIEVKCSNLLVEEVSRLGGKPQFTRTGHSLIKARMRETGALFAGEMSGHMFFADEYYGFDDALYAAGRLLRILAAAREPLSELLADLPECHATPETRIPCADEAKAKIVEKVGDFLRSTHEVIEIDGVRVVFPDGWGLIRASNTQPALVARAEAKTVESLARIKAALEEALWRAGKMPIPWETEAEV